MEVCCYFYDYQRNLLQAIAIRFSEDGFLPAFYPTKCPIILNPGLNGYIHLIWDGIILFQFLFFHNSFLVFAYAPFQLDLLG